MEDKEERTIVKIVGREAIQRERQMEQQVSEWVRLMFHRGHSSLTAGSGGEGSSQSRTKEKIRRSKSNHAMPNFIDIPPTPPLSLLSLSLSPSLLCIATERRASNYSSSEYVSFTN